MKNKNNDIYPWSKSKYFSQPGLTDEQLQSDLLGLIKELGRIESSVKVKEELDKKE